MKKYNISINIVETGRNISSIRKSKGMSVKSLQEIFGFSTPQSIYKWENGINLPTIDNLLILSELFGISIEDILVTERK